MADTLLSSIIVGRCAENSNRNFFYFNEEKKTVLDSQPEACLRFLFTVQHGTGVQRHISSLQ